MQEIAQLRERLDAAESLVKTLDNEGRRTRATQPRKTWGDNSVSEAGKELQGKVTLKVGSQKFHTSAETLKIFPESWFALLASGRVPQKVEEDGSIFVDASSKTFPHVLEYLRCGGKSFTINGIPSAARDELLRQAQYFMLDGLERMLRGVHVYASHDMTLEDHGALLQGRKHSAATLDVPDPNNFQISLSFKNGKAYSPSTSVLIGVAPIDALLDCTWESRHIGPRKLTVPPVADAGLFVRVASESLEVLNTSAQYDVRHYRYELSSGSRVETVKVCFERTTEICKIAFRVMYYAAEPCKWNKLQSTLTTRSWDVTTADFGLTSQADYRPVLFFDEPGWLKIEKA